LYNDRDFLSKTVTEYISKEGDIVRHEN
jgi:hypothetical protein